MSTRTARSADGGYGGNGSISTRPKGVDAAGHPGDHDYVVPLVHLHLSERVVDVGFWAALAGAAVLGAVDLPVAVLIGGTAVIARRHALH